MELRALQIWRRKLLLSPPPLFLEPISVRRDPWSGARGPWFKPGRVGVGRRLSLVGGRLAGVDRGHGWDCSRSGRVGVANQVGLGRGRGSRAGVQGRRRRRYELPVAGAWGLDLE